MVAFIDAHRTMVSGGLRWGVEPICQVLEIAPTTYWSAKTRQPCKRKIRDAELGPKIEAIWVKNYSVYGRRKLAKAVRRAGLDVGRDQVARLMAERGLRGASRAKKRFESAWDPRVLLTLETRMEHGNEERWAAEAAEVSGRAA